MEDEKLKHLEFIQGAISRMATNQFLFKGWAITIAAALSGFAAVDTKYGLLVIAMVSTVLFWALDAYYLWLEQGFRKIHNEVAAKGPDDAIDFRMAPPKDDKWQGWLRVMWKRPHLVFFYGAILIVDFAAIFVVNGAAHHGS